jgi:hypothetical protein
MKYLLMVAAMMVAAPAMAGGSLKVHIGSDTLGCKEQKTLDRISDLVEQGDRDAGVNLIISARRSGECLSIDKGTTVFGEDGDTETSRVLIHVMGDSETYWISARSVAP